MTTRQKLEREIKDLRTRLKNQQVKAELALCAAHDELKELKASIHNKDKTIAMLQKEIAALTKELEEAKQLRSQEIERIATAAIAKATAPILEELDKAHNEISRLKTIINKDSSNSSKPPSSDGPKKIPNNREKSRRKPGGQKGHEGYTLKVPDNLEELAEQGKVKLKIEDHTDGNCEWISSYTIGIDVVPVYTEHRYPAGTVVTPVAYDDSVKAFAVLLAEVECVSLERTAEILDLITNGQVSPSKGSIRTWIAQSAKGAAKRYEEIKQEVLNSQVLHTDETPVRSTERTKTSENGEIVLETAKGKSFNIFIRVYSTLQAVLFTVNAHKGDAGIALDGILEYFFGTLCHDHDFKLYKYAVEHATCNAHLLRDLKGLLELYRISWAQKFRTLLQEMNSHKKADIDCSETSPLGCATDIYDHFSNRWDSLVAEGASILSEMESNSFGYNKLRRMVNRLTKYKDCHMLFLKLYDVPFTNNLAERSLRHCKIKQKVSSAFRSWQGALDYARIWTVVATAKCQGQSPLSAIASTFKLEGVPEL